MKECDLCDLCDGMSCIECEEKYGDDNCDTKQQSLTIDKCKVIVQEVSEEYSYLSKGFDNGLLKRIADYFSSVYEGDDKTAPKMELSVNDLRYIANLNVEKCRLQTEVNNLKKLYKETP